MEGILLVSHGDMAAGMLDTLAFFFQDQMRQIDSLALAKHDDPDAFKEKLQKKIKEIDSGDGVLVFADLYGGTPSNMVVSLLLADRDSDSLRLITGFNLPMLMEAMVMRDPGPIDCLQLMETGKSGIECVNEVLKKRK